MDVKEFRTLVSWLWLSVPYRPVSYTHLDVYKRQVLYSPIQMSILLTCNESEQYTFNNQYR